MNSFLQEILNILTTTPGSFTYYLVLAFSCAGALQMAIGRWRESGYPQARRAVIGLGLLLAVQLAVFAVTAAAGAGAISTAQIAPPLDRAAALFDIVILLWLWGFPETSRLADFAAALLGVLAVILGAFVTVWWLNQGGETFYNDWWVDMAGEALALALLAFGVLILFLRQPNAWGLGLGMFLLLGVGHTVHLILPLAGSHFAGAVRLAEMAAFPLLLTLPHRFPIPSQTGAATLKAPPTEPHRPAVDVRLAQILLELSSESSQEKVCREITRSVASMVVADLCLLVNCEGSNLTFICGYDLIRETYLAGFSLDERSAPGIANAVKRKRTVRLPASSTSPDLLGLAQSLKMERLGQLLVVPLPTGDQAPAAALVLLSPYSGRGWTTEEQTSLQSSAEVLARILQRNRQLASLQVELAETRETMLDAQAQTQQLRQENEEQRLRLNSAQLEANQAMTRAESLAAMVASNDDLQETITRLDAENRQLSERLANPSLIAPIQAGEEKTPEAAAALAIETSPSASQEVTQLEEELRLSLEELAHLRQELSLVEEAQQKAKQQPPEPPPAALPPAAPAEQTEVVASLAQDLRQPMSSIVGYTDLLLGESVGIIGALQRKFLERIKASTERMNGLIDDLVQMLTLDRSQLEIKPEAVNLSVAIDDAIAFTSARIREKNISLRVNLPEQLPEISADRDALQQILIHLLQNAGAATPPEGEITLHARIEDADKANRYVLMQVADTGGGIPTQELPRVFSRLYRADNPLIQGVGDSGVGLSIVKSLVEAQGGRIWVDSEQGRGATFSVLLPLAANNGSAGA